jgi:hypothetical protein
MYFLTPSKANLINECPRCFYYEFTKKAPRPRGIFPSLPTGMDSLLKGRYDKYRTMNALPPELVAAGLTGKLLSNQLTINSIRDWRGPQKLEFKDQGICLRGAMDDVFIEEDGAFSPFDYKSKASKPEPGYSLEYYKCQMEDYALMLNETILKERRFSGNAHLAVYYLNEKCVEDNGAIIAGFNCEIQTITISLASAQERVAKAARILNGPVPESSQNCEYCKFIEQRR